MSVVVPLWHIDEMKVSHDENKRFWLKEKLNMVNLEKYISLKYKSISAREIFGFSSYIDDLYNLSVLF